MLGEHQDNGKRHESFFNQILSSASSCKETKSRKRVRRDLAELDTNVLTALRNATMNTINVKLLKSSGTLALEAVGYLSQRLNEINENCISIGYCTT